MKKYALMLMVLALAACSEEKTEQKKPVAKSVKTMMIETTNDNTKVLFPARVYAGKETEMSFEVSGKLQKLPVIDGQMVKKGELLAQLNLDDFAFNLKKAKAAFSEQEASFARAQELIKNKYISQADFDSKKKTYEVAKADLELSQQNYNYATLRAPYDGRIANVIADNFQTVQANQAILLMQNISNLDIEFFVPEKLVINSLNTSDFQIMVKFDASHDKTYPATLKETTTQADLQTQTYKVTVSLPRPEGINVLPGMTANVQVTANKENQVGGHSTIRVPSDAIFPDTGKNSYVWVVSAENKLKRQQVSVEKFEGNDAILNNGLNVGDTIVTVGVNFLHEGMLVNPIK